MKNLCVLLVLVASLGVYVKAQAEDNYDDYFNYDEFEDLEKFIEEDLEKPENDKTDNDSDSKVEEEIQKFREANDDKEAEEELKDYLADTDGFQLEDNRVKSKETENDDAKDYISDIDGSFESEDGDMIEDDGKNVEDIVENRPEPDDPNAPSRNEDYALLWGDDSVAPLPVPETAEDDNNDENKAIYDETKQILEEMDTDNFEEAIKEAIENDTDFKPEEQLKLENIVEETKQILAESDDTFDDEIINVDFEDSIKRDNDTNDSINEKQEHVEVEVEDTVDKVYEDLNADLDKLFDTIDKLKKEIADEGEDAKVDSLVTAEMVNKNDTVKENKDIENDSDDIDKVSKEINKFFEENNLDNYNLEGSQEMAKDDDSNDDVDLDKLLENILGEDDLKAEDSAAEVFEPYLDDALNKVNPKDDNQNDIESLDSANIHFIDDALVDKVNENAETLENSDDGNANDKKENENVSVEKYVETALVDDLNSSELEDLVAQFAILHEDELDVQSENFEKSVAPVHITLKLGEPTVITSPNYPSPYPTNNIVDWILEGPGEGIELNITDFAVNGALGDYLLIKPGGVDETGQDGLLFTYRLNSERRYRFTDVDRVFMRFQTNLGMMFMRGFSISAKMIAPISSDSELIPQPEAVVTPPHSTATVTLAVRVPDFSGIRDDLRQILADMAEQYIIDYNIDPGVNTTSEVTNITRVGLCPISWPDYESCTAVTFAVSLVYQDENQEPRLNEDDLRTMWTVYSRQDTFAQRLKNSGVSEFYSPDSGVLATWLVISGAVVVAMSVLAFVMWRYSCFEDYTRMKTYSDTASLHNEKRNLDLYPTPHQNLPPLYAEQEYKWPEEDATRVDVGGFANRSYRRDMYDFDSEEEVVTTPNRNGVDFSSNV